jgi:ATP-binding protein involved in chromosome partitioning
LSLAQLTDLTGAVIVTTPQKVATLDASKAIAMFEQVKVPILGLIENMSYFIPPDAPEKKYYIFGQGGAEELAKSINSKVLGKIPHMIDVMEGGDSGMPNLLNDKDGIISKVYTNIVKELEEEIKSWE